MQNQNAKLIVNASRMVTVKSKLSFAAARAAVSIVSTTSSSDTSAAAKMQTLRDQIMTGPQFEFGRLEPLAAFVLGGKKGRLDGSLYLKVGASSVICLIPFFGPGNGPKVRGVFEKSTFSRKQPVYVADIGITAGPPIAHVDTLLDAIPSWPSQLQTMEPMPMLVRLSDVAGKKEKLAKKGANKRPEKAEKKIDVPKVKKSKCKVTTNAGAAPAVDGNGQGAALGDAKAAARWPFEMAPSNQV